MYGPLANNCKNLPNSTEGGFDGPGDYQQQDDLDLTSIISNKTENLICLTLKAEAGNRSETIEQIFYIGEQNPPIIDFRSSLVSVLPSVNSFFNFSKSCCATPFVFGIVIGIIIVSIFINI
jgi:hypothetical protein